MTRVTQDIPDWTTAPPNDEDQPYTFRYLQNPDSETWLRGGSTHSFCPRRGDFVVLQLDPKASAAHLDAAARRAARAIRPRKYVAFILQGYGIPLPTKPTDPHDILLVRRGMPRARKPPFDAPETCIPILPNTSHPLSRNPVRPAQPLPWPDRYLETTFGLPVSCRITTTQRNYTSVLPISIPDLIKMRKYVREDQERRFDLRDRLRAGSLDAVASIPLPASPDRSTASLQAGPLFSPGSTLSVKRDRENTLSDTASSRSSVSSPGQNADADVISIIASDNSDIDDEIQDDRDREHHRQLDLGMMLHFQDFMNDTGDLDDPVVNVWYDLDEVSEIHDPDLFLEECAQVKRIAHDAKLRLGIIAGDTEEDELRLSRPSPLCSDAPAPAEPGCNLEASQIVEDGGPQRTLRWLNVSRKLNSLLARVRDHLCGRTLYTRRK
ncbi:unnamed protein product [Peniophora sp. CBMAI 1063]|nr:unnamed protein product [Peniophora sp. CBMAI 1063]